MLEENTLVYEEFKELIESVGWRVPAQRLVEIGLKNSLTVKYIIDNKVVGMARLVSDTGYIGLIADVIVKPEYQRQGIGKKMIQTLLDRAYSKLEDGESMMLQLLSADGKREFYKQFGFKDKKEIVECGMYMWLKK